MFRRIGNDSVHVHYLRLCDVALTPNKNKCASLCYCPGPEEAQIYPQNATLMIILDRVKNGPNGLNDHKTPLSARKLNARMASIISL